MFELLLGTALIILKIRAWGFSSSSRLYCNAGNYPRLRTSLIDNNFQIQKFLKISLYYKSIVKVRKSY